MGDSSDLYYKDLLNCLRASQLVDELYIEVIGDPMDNGPAGRGVHHVSNARHNRNLHVPTVALTSCFIALGDPINSTAHRETFGAVIEADTPRALRNLDGVGMRRQEYFVAKTSQNPPVYEIGKDAESLVEEFHKHLEPIRVAVKRLKSAESQVSMRQAEHQLLNSELSYTNAAGKPSRKRFAQIRNELISQDVKGSEIRKKAKSVLLFCLGMARIVQVFNLDDRAVDQRLPLRKAMKCIHTFMLANIIQGKPRGPKKSVSRREVIDFFVKEARVSEKTAKRRLAKMKDAGLIRHRSNGEKKISLQLTRPGKNLLILAHQMLAILVHNEIPILEASDRRRHLRPEGN